MKEKKIYFPERESDASCTIRELIERNKPLYIYGVGETAKRVEKKLAAHGITISGYFVDQEYDGEAAGKGEGGPVFSFEYVMGLDAADVVIGFYQFGAAYSKIERGALCNRGKVFFVNPDPLFDYGYYLDNRERFEQTCDWLADDLSKTTMRAYMDGRMNGVMRPLWECCVPDQYFIPEIVFTSREVYLDCGMYDGDTVVEFIKRCPDYTRIVGFEPDGGNIERFRRRGLPTGRLEVHCAGVWSEKTTLRFSADGTTASRVEESGGASLPVLAIDSLELDEAVTFIKMDIEGSELEALKGARSTIQRDMPKLAICVYHRKEDMVTIPQYIKSLETEGRRYSFYLRHHSLYEHETVLYAVPVEKYVRNEDFLRHDRTVPKKI